MNTRDCLSQILTVLSVGSRQFCVLGVHSHCSKGPLYWSWDTGSTLHVQRPSHPQEPLPEQRRPESWLTHSRSSHSQAWPKKPGSQSHTPQRQFPLLEHCNSLSPVLHRERKCHCTKIVVQTVVTAVTRSHSCCHIFDICSSTYI